MAKNSEDQFYENFCKLSSTLKESIALVRLLNAQFDTERVNGVIDDARIQEIVDEHFFDIKDAADNIKILSMNMDTYTTLRRRVNPRTGLNVDSGYARSIDSGILPNDVQAVEEEQCTRRYGCLQTDVPRSMSLPIQEQQDEMNEYKPEEPEEKTFSDTV